jgi:hypothetical protein
MRRLRQVRRLPTITALAASAALVVAALALPAPGASATAGAPTGAGIAPRSLGELDCNGLSPIQQPVKNSVQCADPRGSWKGRFYENGHYIGHDEPSIRFISAQPGSGDNVSCDNTHWCSALTIGQCLWEFGNMRNGNTFGGDAQYGSVGPDTLGAFASAVQPNPEC